MSALTPKESDSVSEQIPEGGTWERTVARDVLLGARIGEYVVQKRVGAGGMGIVYEALQPLIHRRVAIKILRPQEGTDADDRTLLDEARAVTSIRHRGIVDVFGFGELPGVGQYMVMEFLQGKPLDELIAQTGRLSAEETVDLLEDILSPLQAAHDRGLIHRDLKPNNIFQVEDDGGRYLKILDFGLAKRKPVKGEVGKQTRQGVAIGTPHYMSPEQAMAYPVTPRADLYAVGVIGYEMLTGRVPFDGQPMEILIKQVNEEPKPPSEFADVPPELEKLILRLLAKDPALRPASAGAVRAELKTIKKQLSSARTQMIVTGEHLKMTPPRPGAAVAAPTSRVDIAPAALAGKRKMPVALLAVGGALLISVVAATFFLTRSPPRIQPPPVATPVGVAPVVEEKVEPPSKIVEPVIEQKAVAPAQIETVEPPEVVPVEKKEERRVVKPELPPRKTVKQAVVAATPVKVNIGVIGGNRSQVHVDGKPLCTIPCVGVLVPSGKRRLRFIHPTGTSTTFAVDVSPNTQRIVRRWDGTKNTFIE